MAKTIALTRGTTYMFTVTVTDKEGRLYTLGNGEFLKFGVKQKPEDEEYLVYKEIVAGENGVYPVELAPDDTIGLPYGRYVYDIGLQSVERYFNIIPTSAFAVLPNVTEWGAVE